MRKCIAVALIMSSVASVSFAAHLSGQSTDTIKNKKYCQYSNGTNITIQVYELCPLSI